MKQFIAILISSLLLVSCGSDDDTTETTGTAPILPDIETMIIDFGEMSNKNKSTDLPESNWEESASLFLMWNLVTIPIFSVPATCYRAAFNNQPTQINDISWLWEYDVNEYTARLKGTVVGNEIKWRMEISKGGESGFSDFLWFEGTSQVGRLSGQWIIYHSPEFPEETIQIDWIKEGEEVGEVTYTYIRQQNNAGEPDGLNGSSLSYGLQNETFDAYVNLHLKDVPSDNYLDINVEWSRADYSGRIKAPHIFMDDEWYCWDQNADNIDCN